FWMRLSTTLTHVAHVAQMRPEIKMPNTRRVVATMKDRLPIGDGSVLLLPYPARYADVLGVHPEVPVPLGVLAACPDAARRRHPRHDGTVLVDPWPKAFLWRDVRRHGTPTPG